MKPINKTLTILARWLGAFFMSTFFCIAMLNGAAVASDDDGITVTVLLFSGRPDPEYMLENQMMIDKIKASIRGAKLVEGFNKETIIPSILGYKGILVRNSKRRAGLPSQIAVYKGIIEVKDGQKRFLRDAEGNLEKMLMDEAIRKGVIDEKILMRMKKER